MSCSHVNIKRHALKLMMKYHILFVLLSITLATGCATSQRREREERVVRLRTERQNMRSDVERMKERFADSESRLQEIYRRIDELEEAQQEAARIQRERIEQLERALAQQDVAREKDKADIIDKLSRKMVDLVAANAPGDEPTEGYQHIVKKGETLSEIAAAYGVTPGVIVRLNKLRNANTIRVGQKLFIPE